MKYYLAIKMNEILNLENITLSENSQMQKGTYRMILFIWNAQNGETNRD